MTLNSNLHSDGVADVFRSVLSAADDELLVVDPTAEAVEQLVGVATTFDGELPVVRVVAEDSTLKTVMDDFIVASNAADLIERGVLSLRTVRARSENTLLVTSDAVMALVRAGDQVAALSTDDADFVEAARGSYRARFEEAPEFNLRTPSLSRVRETLGDEIGPSARTDFDTVLDSLATARGNGDGLDEVTISLLVAAKNEVLLYDISKWGEDVGIASKATFSRTKTRLEDMGLIDTEKVPIDVGRPRLRLKLGDDRLREADVDQLAGVAQSLLN